MEMNKEKYEEVCRRAKMCGKVHKILKEDAKGVQEGFDCLVMAAVALLVNQMKKDVPGAKEFVINYARATLEKVIKCTIDTEMEDPKDIANCMATLDRKFGVS